MKKKILVVTSKVIEGKRKINYQNLMREQTQKVFGDDKKITFLHGKHFNVENQNFLKKAKGADVIISDTFEKISHPTIKVVAFASL